MENHRAPRTLVISALLMLILLVPLSYYSTRFFNEANENRNINEIVALEVARVNGSELIELDVQRMQDRLNMIATIRTNIPLRYDQVTLLQKSIATNLQKPVALKVNQILAEQFDPLIPPTFTPTVQFTHTPTQTPTATLTPTPIPTATFTLTPTAGLVQTANGTLPPLKLYQSPGGPVIGQILRKQTLVLLYERLELNGLIWVNVMDSEGRIGWVPEMYLYFITATPEQ
ncbi:MAG: SH3 domain-containing protein [Anaerolineales bacterium]|nr:SH3 domain-containing protein [Anaerolineales bacterium]